MKKAFEILFGVNAESAILHWRALPSFARKSLYPIMSREAHENEQEGTEALWATGFFWTAVQSKRLRRFK
jgi:hypothetical protein